MSPPTAFLLRFLYYNRTMRAITVKIEQSDMDYLDKKIVDGTFSSYGHCVRGLVREHRKTRATIGRLKHEKQRLMFKIEHMEGKL